MIKTMRVKVKVANNVYEMTRAEFSRLLQIASSQVPFGIYAVEKNGYAELWNRHCKSITQLKRIRRDLRQEGFRVYANTEQ